MPLRLDAELYQTLDTITAFTPSPQSERGLMEFSLLKCPISSKCDSPDEGDLLDHLRTCHNLATHKAARGIAEISVPLRLDGKARRQGVILVHDGQSFLWGFESRPRADGEMQISVALSVLPASAASRDRGSSTASGVLDDDESSASTPRSPPTHAMPRYRASIATISAPGVEDTTLFCPSWGGNISLYNNERHEHMVSSGKALVIMYPTHSHLFEMLRDSTKTYRVATRVQIEKL